jgi:outer membrane murein-binding lipoprotein Lpp
MVGDDLMADAKVVFVYSCFRAASTWFWSRLREQREFCCYYEVFNEQLDYLSLADIPAVRPDNWRSRHPDSGPYLTEFAPLLGTEPGIAGFPTESPLGSRFIGRAGIEGPLDHDVEAYLARLLQNASASGRVPVITCTRLLGRAAGLRMAFPGVHILLVRNLFEQWNSVYGQLRSGNDYFLRMVFNQLNFGRQDRFFSYLMSMFDTSGQEDFEGWMKDENSDAVFCCYVVSRVYLLVITRRHCDLVVDVTGLGNPAHRVNTEATLSRLLGVNISLGNFERRIDYPKRIIQSPTDCRRMIDELLERCLSEIDASAEEREFAQHLVVAMWDAHESFMAYTSGAREMIEQDVALIASLRNNMDSLRDQVQDLESQVARLEHGAAAIRQAGEAQRMRAEAVEANLRNRLQDLANLEARLVEAQRHPD